MDKSDTVNLPFIEESTERDKNKPNHSSIQEKENSFLKEIVESQKHHPNDTHKIKKEIIQEFHAARKKTQEVFKKFGHFFKKSIHELNDSARELQTEVLKNTKYTYSSSNQANHNDIEEALSLENLKIQKPLKKKKVQIQQEESEQEEILPKKVEEEEKEVLLKQQLLKAQPFMRYDPEPIEMPRKNHSLSLQDQNSEYISIPILDNFDKNDSKQQKNNKHSIQSSQKASRIRLIKKEPMPEIQIQEKNIHMQQELENKNQPMTLAYQRIDESRPKTIIYRNLNKTFGKTTKPPQSSPKPIQKELPSLLKKIHMTQELKSIDDIKYDEMQWLCEIKDVVKEMALELQTQIIARNPEEVKAPVYFKKLNSSIEIASEYPDDWDEQTSQIQIKQEQQKQIKTAQKIEIDFSKPVPVILPQPPQKKISAPTQVQPIPQVKSDPPITSIPKPASPSLYYAQWQPNLYHHYMPPTQWSSPVPVYTSSIPVATHNAMSEEDMSLKTAPKLLESLPDPTHSILPMSESVFVLPPLHFLQASMNEHFEVDEVEIDKKVNNLLGKLKLFKIEGDIVNIHTGPVVTTFEYRPAAHIKVSRILNLSDDLAMALQAKTLRIEAPVPGKDVVGIEIPNNHSEMILLRDLLESKAFMESDSPLTLALGKDIVGKAFVTDLRKLPHLLIAGTTGSGKSVGINAMILSLLYRNSPKELKFIMIDPKMLEFSIYNDIPHLLTPVITEPKKAITALSATVGEMEKRYAAMSVAQTKNIENYNQKMRLEGGKELPYIVVVIDELADLMMTGGKEVEFHIMRLAQMARASGIHLIIATQRPSVDIVTGSIKTNLPSRISYKVGQKIDSKVILDGFGAETLLGRGDMLFTSSDGSGIKRLHAPWSSEEEILKIVDFLKAQCAPDYDEEFLKSTESQGSKNASIEGDDLYIQAKQIILSDKKTSASYIQRRLSIGYNRAANIIEELEREGFLSAPNSKGVREILG